MIADCAHPAMVASPEDPGNFLSNLAPHPLDQLSTNEIDIARDRNGKLNDATLRPPRLARVLYDIVTSDPAWEFCDSVVNVEPAKRCKRVHDVPGSTDRPLPARQCYCGHRSLD
ncbi:hypothetical protein BGX38DRAFT_1247286, partial [Terfezia claveryi]